MNIHVVVQHVIRDILIYSQQPGYSLSISAAEMLRLLYSCKGFT